MFERACSNRRLKADLTDSFFIFNQDENRGFLMKKSGILNAELMKALTEARHGDCIILLDAGMPVPEKCRYIDIGLVRGIPSFLQVLHAVLGEFIAERYEVYDLMPTYNPAMYQTIQAFMPNVPGSTVTESKMLELMKTAKAVIRTAEFGSCCNMVLYSASGMDKYVEKFNIDPPKGEEL